MQFYAFITVSQSYLILV